MRKYLFQACTFIEFPIFDVSERVPLYPLLSRPRARQQSEDRV